MDARSSGARISPDRASRERSRRGVCGTSSDAGGAVPGRHASATVLYRYGQFDTYIRVRCNALQMLMILVDRCAGAGIDECVRYDGYPERPPRRLPRRLRSMNHKPGLSSEIVLRSNDAAAAEAGKSACNGAASASSVRGGIDRLRWSLALRTPAAQLPISSETIA